MMKMNKELIPISNFVIFKTDNGKVNVPVFFCDDTLWLTQKTIAELFEKNRSTISEHLKNIFSEGELNGKVVCREFRHTTSHGAIKDKEQVQSVKYYNLRAITAVGYRVYSKRATEFRKWSTKVYMGLKTWNNSTDGKILKSNVTIAKNYLNKEHIRELEGIVSAYLEPKETLS